MQFNTKSGFCPKQNLFIFEKYAEVHMHMNDMMKFPNLKSGMLHLKHAMHTRFVSPHYQCDLLKKLSRLEHGKNVEQEYYQELQTCMIRCGIVEDNEAMLACFFGGLNK
jgi:hypothetical protein